MNFDLNEEQTMLKDSVSRFVQQQYDFEARNKAIANELGFEYGILGSSCAHLSRQCASDSVAPGCEPFLELLIGVLAGEPDIVTSLTT